MELYKLYDSVTERCKPFSDCLDSHRTGGNRNPCGARRIGALIAQIGDPTFVSPNCGHLLIEVIVADAMPARTDEITNEKSPLCGGFLLQKRRNYGS